ncbi:ATP-dependent 6-phosphofructokinase [Kiritimatiella glycovorans]|uniref:Pyrophosphate--fructose 6-phosphate 1-phosphotransferase n=1 Tax=Kiritimatiella glycovorans TaxID=1307763 RepID=A0A0G3EAF1_9BACT|nr:ATP-dependent 6-phosphofructokinase [Kiritimatiella glycovorans]AKJ63416.1 Pyrophosphate--fructose 6-phosphate 1-phosphotransferase [Kiritimatiella glycovorans]
MNPDESMFRIVPTETLGPCRYDSPLGAMRQRFYTDGEWVIRRTRSHEFEELEGPPFECFERSGAREKLYFRPQDTTVGIVTCGGLCPGINDVIRAITFAAAEGYGVKQVLGFQYGYEGLVAKYYHRPIELNPDNTDDIHEKGGSILKSSRGPQDTGEIVDTLQHYCVDILFAIGGDGTMRGVRDIHDEIARRGLRISVIGVPKTIDNDISLVERTFGYETAVESAWSTITSAHAEAKGYRNGIGLVKLMGRDSGWIAASTALANSNVNFCLIPEVPFDLEPPNGFLEHLRRRLMRRAHAVIVVAEGAGQNLFEGEYERDKSGNKRLHDIGVLLQEQIERFFAEQNTEINLKYFDPSYLIRSTPANANDSEYCLRLGHNAVHAAMAGKTNCIVGLHCGVLVNLPMPMIGERKRVDPNGWTWQSVLQATRQPADMTHEE